MSKKYNPLYDPATDNLPIDPRVQSDVINAPKNLPSGMSQEDQSFLETLIQLVDSGKINLYSPSSLLNQTVYTQLSEQDQGKVDMEAINMLSTIRQIHGLYKAGFTQTFQIENLVRHLRLLKERLEGISGDVFII